MKLFFHVLNIEHFFHTFICIFVVVHVFALICLFLFSNHCQCKHKHFGRIHFCFQCVFVNILLFLTLAVFANARSQRGCACEQWKCSKVYKSQHAASARSSSCRWQPMLLAPSLATLVVTVSVSSAVSMVDTSSLWRKFHRITLRRVHSRCLEFNV